MNKAASRWAIISRDKQIRGREREIERERERVKFVRMAAEIDAAIIQLRAAHRPVRQ